MIGAEGLGFDVLFAFAGFENTAAAAGEACPVWPGAPLRAHWGIDDPAAAPPDQVDMAFRLAYERLAARTGALLALPLETMRRGALQAALDRIGRS